VPEITSVMRTYQLDSAGQVMVNQLNLARQTALSRGHAVQIRLYLLPDYNATTSSTPTVYRGMQSFIELDPSQSGTTESYSTSALMKPIFFHAPVVVSSVTSPNAVSPLLPTTANANAADPTTPLPVYGSNYKYAMFHFKADGSTDLTSGLNSLSLVLENDKAGGSGLPANFQTVTIDPLNGAIRSFRP
jgi:uncharacterized protein (TIGR02596 family)